MANIKVNYSGISSDISTLSSNVKNICDSLDKVNNVENVIPESWKSKGAEQYRSAVVTDIIAPIANFEGTLTGLIKMLSEVSDNFDNLENIIGSELNNWFNGMVASGKVLDLVAVSDVLLNYGINYLTQDDTYSSIPYGSGSLKSDGCGFFSMVMAYQLKSGHNLTMDEIKKLAYASGVNGAPGGNYDLSYNTGVNLGLEIGRAHV